MSLVMSQNNLTGGIPVEWGNRSLSLWGDLRLADNELMCGQVPTWFYQRFGGDGPAQPVAMLNGEATVWRVVVSC